MPEEKKKHPASLIIIDFLEWVTEQVKTDPDDRWMKAVLKIEELSKKHLEILELEIAFNETMDEKDPDND